MRAPLLRGLLAVGLLLALYAQLAGGSRLKSATYDEQEYIARGYSILRTGDMRLRVRHPILVNVLSAAPLLLLRDLHLPTEHPSWANAEFHEFAAQFLWQANAQQALKVVALARWPVMLLTVLLAAAVYRWGRALSGPASGLLALALVAFDPNIIAHGQLATTDLGAAALIFGAAFALWAYLRQPSRRRLAVTGIVTGLALTTRFTAGLLLPAMAVQAAWMVSREPGTRQQAALRFGRRMLALVSISGLTVWAIYGLSWGRVPGLRMALPAPDYWAELLSLAQRLTRSDRAFLLGEVYSGGRWSYFPVALAVKTPLPLLLLILWQGIRALRQPRIERTLFLWLPLSIYFLLAMLGNLNTGYRLILPILPFLHVYAAQIAAPDTPQRTLAALRWQRVWVSALLIWLIGGSIAIYPSYLAYFNGLVTPREAYRVLVDSNLDWGQDLPALRDWMTEHGIDEVALSYFGTAPPEAYEVSYRALPGWPPREDPAQRIYHPERPLAGTYALSATNLQGVLLDDPSTFAYFQSRSPDAQIGYSILIYTVEPDGPSRSLALGGLRFDQIPAEALGAHMATHALTLRWFEPASSLVLMPHQDQACYAIATDAPLADPLAERFALTPLAAEPGSDVRWYSCPEDQLVANRLQLAAGSPVYAGDEVQFIPGDDAQRRWRVALPIPIGDTVAYMGYEVLSTPDSSTETLSVLTYWQVLRRPTRDLQLFIHLIDDQSALWGQEDHFGVPVEGWQPGDRFVQLHTIAMKSDAPEGRYWLQVGWYDIQTQGRLPVGAEKARAPFDRLLLEPVVLP